MPVMVAGDPVVVETRGRRAERLLVERLETVEHGAVADRPSSVPLVPGVGGVDERFHSGEELLVGVPTPGGLGDIAEGAGLAFERIESCLRASPVGAAGVDAPESVVDRSGRLIGRPVGVATTPEPSAEGLRVGLVHGRSKLVVELVLERVDAGLVRSPRLSRGVQGGLQLDELGNGALAALVVPLDRIA